MSARSRFKGSPRLRCDRRPLRGERKPPASMDETRADPTQARLSRYGAARSTTTVTGRGDAYRGVRFTLPSAQRTRSPSTSNGSSTVPPPTARSAVRRLGLRGRAVGNLDRCSGGVQPVVDFICSHARMGPTQPSRTAQVGGRKSRRRSGSVRFRKTTNSQVANGLRRGGLPS